MKELLISIVKQYLEIFPDEVTKQSMLLEQLNKDDDNEIIDWNNFNGHVVASGFVYAEKEKKYLEIYHNDLKMFVYPGGHIDKEDQNPYEAARREISEETGIMNIKPFVIGDNKLIPIDIDTHIIPYNERLDLPQHYHFDFIYFFTVDSIEEINLDLSESSKYQWINEKELHDNQLFGYVVDKFKRFMKG